MQLLNYKKCFRKSVEPWLYGELCLSKNRTLKNTYARGWAIPRSQFLPSVPPYCSSLSCGSLGSIGSLRVLSLCCLCWLASKVLIVYQGIKPSALFQLLGLHASKSDENYGIGKLIYVLQHWSTPVTPIYVLQLKATEISLISVVSGSSPQFWPSLG